MFPEAYLDDVVFKIASPPSAQFTRETWWDALLRLYAEDTSPEQAGAVFTDSQRQAITTRIVTDVRAMLLEAVFWTSFLHVPRFFETLFDPRRRQNIQPALVLSMISVGVLMQSSALGRGEAGQKRALKLLDLAHSALQASLLSNWVDTGLVQAAWVRMRWTSRNTDVLTTTYQVYGLL